jgi:hypothetical protein
MPWIIEAWFAASEKMMHDLVWRPVQPRSEGTDEGQNLT